jgi:serine O-acetyltransferase
MAEETWKLIREEAKKSAQGEPLMHAWLVGSVLDRSSLQDAVATVLSTRLVAGELERAYLHEVIISAFAGDKTFLPAVVADLNAVVDRDPACDKHLIPLIYFKGFHALQAHRVAYWLWSEKRRDLARFLQSRVSEVCGVDMHPAARIGKGILIDHATSVVVGETAIIEDNVSMLHEVTLGGTGKQSGDRHPIIRKGVLIGAGAKVLGRVEIGECAKIGAGSVVLDSVQPHTTVAGVPATVVGETLSEMPSEEMSHSLQCKEAKV